MWAIAKPKTDRNPKPPVWQRPIALIMAIVLMLSLSACSSDRPTAVSKPKRVEAGSITEISPPPEIERLSNAFDKYEPQLTIVSPQADTIIQDNKVTVQLNVTDLPIFKNLSFGLGPHVHVTLDGQEYQPLYDLNQTLTFENLTPGTHTIRAFASRPWHESFKNEGAYAQTTFHVYAKTGENTPNPQQPLLTYSRPVGSYGAEPILLDFYLRNAPLHIAALEDSDLSDWLIRATVNGQSFEMENWQPLYLKGFKPGKNWVKLEFLDRNGNLIPNQFNSTVHVIDFQPGGQDTLSRLMRGEEIAAIDKIVDPNFTDTPTPTPSPAPSPTPAIAPSPAPKPTEAIQLSPPNPQPPTPITPIPIPVPITQEAPKVAPQPPTPLPQPPKKAPKKEGWQGMFNKLKEKVTPKQESPKAAPKVEKVEQISPQPITKTAPLVAPITPVPKLPEPVKAATPATPKLTPQPITAPKIEVKKEAPKPELLKAPTPTPMVAPKAIAPKPETKPASPTSKQEQPGWQKMFDRFKEKVMPKADSPKAAPVKPAIKPAIKPVELAPTVKPTIKPEPSALPKVEPKVEVKTEAPKPIVKPTIKPEPLALPKVEPKVEVKTEAPKPVVKAPTPLPIVAPKAIAPEVKQPITPAKPKTEDKSNPPEWQQMFKQLKEKVTPKLESPKVTPSPIAKPVAPLKAEPKVEAKKEAPKPQLDKAPIPVPIVSPKEIVPIPELKQPITPAKPKVEPKSEPPAWQQMFNQLKEKVTPKAESPKVTPVVKPTSNPQPPTPISPITKIQAPPKKLTPWQERLRQLQESGSDNNAKSGTNSPERAIAVPNSL